MHWSDLIVLNKENWSDEQKIRLANMVIEMPDWYSLCKAPSGYHIESYCGYNGRYTQLKSDLGPSGTPLVALEKFKWDCPNLWLSPDQKLARQKVNL
jgi:hypothetical protein